MNQFDQVSSDGHQMSLVGGTGNHVQSDLEGWRLGEGPCTVRFKGWRELGLGKVNGHMGSPPPSLFLPHLNIMTEFVGGRCLNLNLIYLK